jgi:glycosyltransferase involved in cell wall biosynthesis
MKILAIAAYVPLPDRSTGDFRFFEMLKALAREHTVMFCAYDTVDWLGEIEIRPYRSALAQCGVMECGKDPIAAIKSEPFGAILFEFYFTARSYIDEARFWQPAARILIDSVDIHFHRLAGKARLTKNTKDYSKAQKLKSRELAAYRKADVVTTVSEEDRQILRREVRDLRVEVIPLIHDIPPLGETARQTSSSLLFVGNFHHHPNVDAMVYFCSEILPLIRHEAPNVRLTIVGNSPPEAVKNLASDAVNVLGYVPDLKPLLHGSDISIAPLRYGGGIKGKISEAMAYGLPVVTTSVGTEGFGLSAGENVLVGDTPRAFADGVVRLIRDRRLYDKLRKEAWTFVNERYSVSAVSKQIQDLVGTLESYPVKKLSPAKIFGKAFRYQFDRYVSWRFKQVKAKV